jgi:hypothetical protein
MGNIRTFNSTYQTCIGNGFTNLLVLTIGIYIGGGKVIHYKGGQQLGAPPPTLESECECCGSQPR